MSLAMACNNTLEGLGSLSQNSSMNLGAYGDDSASGGFGPDFTQLTEDSALQEILMNMQQTDSKFGGMEGGGPGTWTPPSQLDMWISTVPEADSGGSMPSMHSKFTSDRRLAALGERDMLIDPPQEGRTNLFHSFWDGVPPVPKWSSDPSQNLGNSMLLSPGLNSDVSSSSFLTEQDLKPSMASMFRSSSATALGSLGSFQGFSGSLMPPLEPQPGGLDAILNTLVSQQQQQQQQQSGVPQRRMSDGQLYNRSAQTLLNHQTQIQQSILLKSILEEHMAQRLPPKKPASHSAAERVSSSPDKRRRDRINDRFNTLRELVPGCSKSDKASVLAEVIEYVKKLQVQSRLWEDKHLASSTVTPDAMSHEKQQMNEITAWRGTGHTDSPATTSGATHTQEEEGNSLGDDISIEADGTALLIKICCPDRKGLLAGISAALRDLSLYVHEADVVTSNSRAVDTFRVVPEGNLVQSMDIIKRRLLAVAFPGGVPVHLAVVKQELHLQTPDTRLKNDEKRRRISSEG